MEQQVMVHVVLLIERRERQPGKNRWKRPVLDRFPKDACPLDVVVTVESPQQIAEVENWSCQKMMPMATAPTKS